jgi:hypothetical protein
MQMRCAWADCTETYAGRLPNDWTFLVTFRQELSAPNARCWFGGLNYRTDAVIQS